MSGLVAAPAQGGEEETGMAVSDPMTAQALQGRFRQRHEAVFGALAAVDMDHLALAIDVGDLQMLSFLQSQTAGVDGGEEGAVVRCADAAEDGAHLFEGQHGGQAPLALCADQIECMPIALQDMEEEEADTAIADPHGVGRPAIAVLAVEEVLLKLGLRDLIWGLVVELAEHAQCAHIGLLRALAETVELQGIDRFLVPFGHHDVSPLLG